MTGRFPSSAIFRSALAAHASLSLASLLSSAFGPSQLTQKSTDSPPPQRHPPSSASISNYHRGDIARMCTALPWLDDLNSVIAEMYISGGTKKKYGCSSRPQLDGTMVQIGEHVSFENPIIAYQGAGEVERAFRGRFRSHPQNDVKTVLECIDVEASDDSISCGSADNSQNQHPSNPPTINHIP